MARAAWNCPNSLVCVVNSTSYPALTARCPRACAMWLLPVPQGPAMRTATFSFMKAQVARSLMKA